ncbi:DUF7351 domain-containing protein [Halobaculum sp. EA56]|uniref:DUF7351 domain-containing protein n=1 Tax=Halobaculum sp. EA56 TaxID=3421648 RepID=UPI003EBD9762
MNEDAGAGDERVDAASDGSDAGVRGGGRAPEESFARLGNELRFSILEVLHDRLTVGDRSDYTVPYSELREAVGEEDSGRFGYHLDRLLGEFVEKRPGGYAIRYPGKEIVRTVYSGAVDERTEAVSRPVDADCYLCGDPVRVAYADGYVSACCTSCEGALAFDFTPEGALSSLPVPAGAVGDAVETAPLDLLDRVHGWFSHRARSFGDGICPRCGGTVVSEIRACPAHDAEGGPCDECGTALPATVEVTCRVCSESGIVPGGCAVSHRYPFRTALADAGVDRLGYDAFAVAMGWPSVPTERDGDPAVAYDLPTESAPVVVDGDLDIHVGG